MLIFDGVEIIFNVEVNYRSGNRKLFWCKVFDVKGDTYYWEESLSPEQIEDLVKLIRFITNEYNDFDQGLQDRKVDLKNIVCPINPIKIGAEDIESVWQVESYVMRKISDDFIKWLSED